MSGIIGGAGSKSGVIGETEIEYEEGTFTPVLTSGAVGYEQGRYVKVGSCVHVSMRFSDVNGGTTSDSTTQMITGMPFTSAAEPAGGFTIDYLIRVSSPYTYGDLHIRMVASNTTCSMHWFDSTGTGADTIRSEWNTGGSSMYCSGTYFIA